MCAPQSLHVCRRRRDRASARDGAPGSVCDGDDVARVRARRTWRAAGSSTEGRCTQPLDSLAVSGSGCVLCAAARATNRTRKGRSSQAPRVAAGAAAATAATRQVIRRADHPPPQAAAPQPEGGPSRARSVKAGWATRERTAPARQLAQARPRSRVRCGTPFVGPPGTAPERNRVPYSAVKAGYAPCGTGPRQRHSAAKPSSLHLLSSPAALPVAVRRDRCARTRCQRARDCPQQLRAARLRPPATRCRPRQTQQIPGGTCAARTSAGETGARRLTLWG